MGPIQKLLDFARSKKPRNYVQTTPTPIQLELQRALVIARQDGFRLAKMRAAGLVLRNAERLLRSPAGALDVAHAITEMEIDQL